MIENMKCIFQITNHSPQNESQCTLPQKTKVEENPKMLIIMKKKK